MNRIDPGATLVVTRPADDAASLVEALQARGRDVVAMPVLGIEAVDDASVLQRTMDRIRDYRLVVFVSPNAIRHALACRREAWPRETAIGVMGPGSVETLAHLGIEAPAVEVVVPDAGRFDSEALFETLARRLGVGRHWPGRVLIVRGNGGRGWLVEHLAALGIPVDEVEAYRRVRPRADASATRRLRDLFERDAAPVFVVTSSEGLDHLVEIVVEAVDAADVRAWLLRCPVLAPHERIVEKAQHHGFRHVLLCPPGDRGILAAIE